MSVARRKPKMGGRQPKSTRMTQLKRKWAAKLFSPLQHSQYFSSFRIWIRGSGVVDLSLTALMFFGALENCFMGARVAARRESCLRRSRIGGGRCAQAKRLRPRIARTCRFERSGPYLEELEHPAQPHTTIAVARLVGRCEPVLR